MTIQELRASIARRIDELADEIANAPVRRDGVVLEDVAAERAKCELQAVLNNLDEVLRSGVPA